MFDLSDRRLAVMPVEWATFSSDGEEDARRVDQRIRIKVELVDAEVFNLLFVEPADTADQATREAFAKLTSAEKFEKLAVGWDVKDKGKPAPFTAANKARLINWPGFGHAFTLAYVNMWAGVEKVREGNSEASPGNGPGGASESKTTTS